MSEYEENQEVPDEYQDQAIALMRRFMTTKEIPPQLSLLGVANEDTTTWQQVLNNKLNVVYQEKPEYEAKEIEQDLHEAVMYYFLAKSMPAELLEETGIPAGDEERVLKEAVIPLIGQPATQMMIFEMRSFCPPLTKD